jgi:NADH-ubiquinone oxidoreductase chain 2
LSISSVESTQAFIFYLIQYSISNLNAFIILISIGFTLFSYISNNKEYKDLLDKSNSPEREGALARRREPSSNWV